MKFVIYDPITKEVACIYDEFDDNLACCGRFMIKSYIDETDPCVTVYDDNTTLLNEFATIVYTEYFDENYDYNEEDDEDDL
jgi:hypothetical protein